jgi:ectoine hydroxylase-related dioxygenase (phytanoyl-CoA dioxygenase family)
MNTQDVSGTPGADDHATLNHDSRTPGEAFREDGITRLRSVLDPDLLARCREVFDWSLTHPGTITKTIFPGTDDEHWADNVNPSAREICQKLVRAPVFAEIVADMLDTQRVWYSAEEIFFKQGSKVGRTPWHQDTSYAPYGGKQWCNLWISFESLAAWNGLEVVQGSHHGPQYDGSSYDDPDNPARPLHGGDWTPLPDIERERSADPAGWPVLSYATEPGDLIVFHPHSLHGGAPLSEACPIRHTLVLRFFDDDSVIRDEFAGLEAGETLCCDRFLQLR